MSGPDEMEDLRRTSAAFLSTKFPVARLAALDNAPVAEPSEYEDLVALGWTDADLGCEELAVLGEETGAALLHVPWAVTMLVARPLLPVDDDLREAIGRGQAAATVAWSEDGGAGLLAGAWESTAVLDTSRRVSGTKTGVLDLDKVSHLLVLASAGNGTTALAAIDLAGQGGTVRVSSQESIDATRSVSTVELSAAPARLLGLLDHAGLLRWEAHVLAGLAAEALGVARAVLEVALDHARLREQFGQPIGSFQAVAHRLSAVHQEVELARSLVRESAARTAAAEHVDAGDLEDVVALCRAARVRASRAALSASEAAIQVHGGVGMTWEHVVHRYYKRALLMAGVPGRTAQHLALLGEHVALGRW